MLCDECKERPAKVFITQIINQQKYEQRLCEECAKRKSEGEAAFAQPLSVQDFLKGLFQHALPAQPFATETACPQCGMTYSDFERQGKFGCRTCYATFAARIEPMLRRIHGASQHNGKLPRRAGSRQALYQRIQHLRQTLERCVAQEEYEQAAALRDEIRGLEQQAAGKEGLDRE